MKQIKTKSGNIGIIEVPKLAFYFDWIEGKNGNIYIYWETEDGRIEVIKTNFQKWSDFEILNKLSQLDKELDEFIDVVSNNLFLYRDYLCKDFTILKRKQSFISLIKSQHPEFQEDKEYLLIRLL